VDKIDERKGDTLSDTEERQLADAWLSAELNRVWIVAERCLRQFQRAQLRPQPDHPSVAEIEGIFTARRTARNLGSTGPLDEGELQRALADCEAKLEPLRRAAPIGRIVENLRLRPLEVETLIVTMAPHIDAPLADVFALLRGTRPVAASISRWCRSSSGSNAASVWRSWTPSIPSGRWCRGGWCR
jgi:hypothetical protein